MAEDDTVNTALVLRKDLEAAGIEYVDDAGRYTDFLALRHSSVSLLAKGNVHPKLAQKLARHSDINLTMSRYSHTLLTDEALEVLPEFPSVFDDDTADNHQPTLRATGTDDMRGIVIPLPQNSKTSTLDTGESVLPSGLPESVAPKGSSVHLRALKRACKR